MASRNGNLGKVGKYHLGWNLMKRIPVIPGGRSAHELARLTGMTQQAISFVEHQALRKLKLKLLEQGIQFDDVCRSLQLNNQMSQKEL